MESTASAAVGLRYIGLANANTGTDPGGILFAIRLQGGWAEVRESNLYRTDTPYAAGDVFRIAVESGLVKYYKNGALFFTSTVAPTYPLRVGASILSLNATISNALIWRAQ